MHSPIGTRQSFQPGHKIIQSFLPPVLRWTGTNKISFTAGRYSKYWTKLRCLTDIFDHTCKPAERRSTVIYFVINTSKRFIITKHKRRYWILKITHADYTIGLYLSCNPSDQWDKNKKCAVLYQYQGMSQDKMPRKLQKMTCRQGQRLRGDSRGWSPPKFKLEGTELPIYPKVKWEITYYFSSIVHSAYIKNT